MDRKRIILLEFNELCPNLLQQWISEDLLPNFKRFYEDSTGYITESDEKEAPFLNPWIQWYSLHTGLSYQQHKVFHLTDGSKAGHKDIWEILLERGETVGNCCSMNTKGFEKTGSFFIPDPWSTGQKPHPSELNVFYKVVANEVQEYSNKNRSNNWSDKVSLLSFLLTHGLRGQTLFNIARQIISDTIIDKKSSWKRASLLDKLQFDVFRYYQRHLRPSFSTFFINSTAHYQHSYWKYMTPELFGISPTSSETLRYKECILFGYQEMDKLLGDFFEFEKEDTMLILATALSQQPYLEGKISGEKSYYRPNNIESLLGTLNVSFEKVRPVMTNQYLVDFKDNDLKERAFEILKGLQYEGSTIFSFSKSEPNTLFFGNRIHHTVDEKSQITMVNEPNKSFQFYDLFYKIDVTKSAYHHPDGILWLKNGKHQRHDRKVSILDVFPTILSHFGVSIEGNILNI